MHVLILLDRETAQNEQGLLSRLEIGLAAAGLRVTAVLPEEARSTAAPVLCAATITYQSTGLPLSRPYRIRRFLESLAQPLGAPGAGKEPTVLHVIGEGAWPFALELHRRTGVTTLLEIDAGRQIAPLARSWPPAVGPTASASGLLGAITTSADFFERLKKLSPAMPVWLARWGVHSIPVEAAAPHSLTPTPGAGFAQVLPAQVVEPQSPVAPPPPQPAVVPSVAVVAEGARWCISSIQGCIEGLALVAKEAPDFLVFLDARAAENAAVWKSARQAGLVERLSVVADFEARRDQVLQTSALVMPECLSRHRSITLSAMAAGLPIVALRDPHNEWIDPARCFPVGKESSGADAFTLATPAEWAEAIRVVLRGGPAVKSITTAAQTYVRAKHGMHGYVQSVLGAYERLFAEGAAPPAPPSSSAAARTTPSPTAAIGPSASSR